MADQFNVVRLEEDPRTHELNIVSVMEVFTEFGEALGLRNRLTELTDQLKMIGVMFAVQYQIGIQQVRTVPGFGTRKRLINLESEVPGNDDLSFFGGSADDLLAKAFVKAIGGPDKVDRLHDEIAAQYESDRLGKDI